MENDIIGSGCKFGGCVRFCSSQQTELVAHWHLFLDILLLRKMPHPSRMKFNLSVLVTQL